MPIVERGDLDGGLIPEQYTTDIIQESIKSSLALSTFRRVNMPRSVSNLPVLDTLPVASWVNGEVADDATGGVKAATNQAWGGVVLTAQEIAAIVVIPEAVIEDTSINLWEEITPRLGESIGAKLDAAVFAGTDTPFTDVIIDDAITATNEVVAATPDQDDYNTAFGLLEADGFMPRRIFAKLGQKANFRGWSASGVPIFLTDVRDDGRVDSVYGVPISYDEFGALGANTHAVIGDPTKAILGVRRDMQAKLLTEATIDVSAAQDGSAMVYLAQQDSVALRVRARFAFAVANPTTVLGSGYPFSVLSAT